MFPPTEEDLTHSGEYSESEETPTLGDKLPTSTQTRPKVISEAQRDDYQHETEAYTPNNTGDPSSSSTPTSPSKKRKAEEMANEGPVIATDTDNVDIDATISTAKKANGVNGHDSATENGERADEVGGGQKQTFAYSLDLGQIKWSRYPRKHDNSTVRPRVDRSPKQRPRPERTVQHRHWRGKRHHSRGYLWQGDSYRPHYCEGEDPRRAPHRIPNG